MEKVIWCDLDGTLCNVNHRVPLLKELENKGLSYRERIDLFTAQCDNDQVNDWCLKLIRAMRAKGYPILFVTGRSEKFRSETCNWMMHYLDLDLLYRSSLFMRPEGSSQADSEFKESIYMNQIKPHYQVLFCLEDRPSVACMLRSHGLICLQVDDKEF